MLCCHLQLLYALRQHPCSAAAYLGSGFLALQRNTWTLTFLCSAVAYLESGLFMIDCCIYLNHSTRLLVTYIPLTLASGYWGSDYNLWGAINWVLEVTNAYGLPVTLVLRADVLCGWSLQEGKKNV